MKPKSGLILTLLIIIILSSSQACASVLGSVVNSYYQNIVDGVYYYHNEFNSSLKDVGLQNEYYFEYFPNSSALPHVVNGSSIYGKRTLTNAASLLNGSGVIGINADYFSFKTGIPMGHTIIDGEIVTKDNQTMDAIGFDSTGGAFIGSLAISTIASSKYGDIKIDNINKWCQPGMTECYMLSDYFADTTKTSSKCYFIVLDKLGGRLKFGENTLICKVNNAYEYTGEINIPKDKYIIVMDVDTANANMLSYFKQLMVGDEIKFTCISVNDARFASVQNAIGSIGGRLIREGKKEANLSKSAEPRSAIGITSSGTVIFYAIDGRQQGFSYGVGLNTLADRLIEIGCVNALNLDGGGSTTIGARFNGNFKLLNNPSGGSQRQCANFIFLCDYTKADKKLAEFVRLFEIIAV